MRDPPLSNSMSTSIEQAISSVLKKNDPLTVAKVLVAYLKVLGYIPPDAKEVSVPHEALVAFEHALDKEPALSQRQSAAPGGGGFCKRLYTAEITQLREEYWKERLGASGTARCTCPSCGKTVAYRKEELEEADAEVKSAPKRIKGGRRRLKGRRITKARRELACGNPPFDPYAPSTSAFVL